MGTVRVALDPGAARFGGSSFPGLSLVQGTNFPVFSLAFDASSTERAYWKVPLLNYGSGNITCTVEWYADTASSGGVTWETALAAITPNTDTTDVETKAFATANTATDTHLGTTGQRVHTVDVTISNLDGVAAGDVVWLRVSRLPADAGDTMTGDAMLLGLTLAYSDS